MLTSHRRAMQDICACRTPALGGEMYLCKPCDEFRYSYHSCKNRHCPKCGNDQATAWLQQQFRRMLPLPYFLVTFTLPQELRPVARSNQKIVYSILINSAAQALLKLARNERYIGGMPGIVSVLQTWTRDLRYHPHVHMIVTAGGLAGDGFHRSSPNFLVPQGALRKIFRAKFRDALRKQLPQIAVPCQVWKKRWVVDLRPVGSGRAAFRYLAAYIFRVALSNKRILSLQDGIVTFQYEDAKTKRSRRQPLPAEQFISRFLQHVLPKGFRKVRYFGIFSPQRGKQLQCARWLLPPASECDSEDIDSTAPPAANQCPKCKQPMQHIGPIPRDGQLHLLITNRSP